MKIIVDTKHGCFRFNEVNKVAYKGGYKGTLEVYEKGTLRFQIVRREVKEVKLVKEV